MPATSLKALSDRYLSKPTFLRGRWRLLVAWPVCAGLVALFGWLRLFQALEGDRAVAEAAIHREAEVLARSYAGQLERAIQGIDLILLHVRYEWRLTGGKLRLESAQDEGLFPASENLNIGILDRDGNLITNTLGRRQTRSAVDRSYFTFHQNNEADVLYAGTAAQGRASNRSVVHFSRKLFSTEGGLDGIVRASVSPAYLTADYDELALAEHGMAALVGDDGEVRAVRFGNKVYEWNDASFKDIPRFHGEFGSVYLDGGTWFVDGRSRYVAWDRLDNYPLIAITGIEAEHALLPYRRQHAAAIDGAIKNTLALLVFTAIATALTLRLAWRAHQLDAAHATYRTATEGGSDGFYIIRPLYDGRTVIDFLTIDCNERGAQFLGMSQDELIGKKMSDLYTSPLFDQRMALYRKALHDGFYEGEIEQVMDTPGVPRWVHLRAVRSGDDLAVTLTDVSDARRHVEELERRGNEDALTQLPNRHWVQSYLPGAMEHALRSGTLLALLFIDLDGFKAVNDTSGHAAGDDVLRNAARRLKLAVRPGDHVARLGGDEFVVILEHLAEREDAAHVAERVMHAFRDKFRIAQSVHSIGTSIGIAVCPDDARDAITLLRNADIAMYSVKTSGKRNYRFFDEGFYDTLRERLRNEEDLRHAIENDQFVMYYQPRMDLEKGVIVSMEALVRWAHPSRGMISPNEFIPLAEQTGLIVELGNLVADKVCAQLSHWVASGERVVPVSINVSSRQFNETNVASILAKALSRHGIDASLIEVELTESSMMGEDNEVREALAAIQKMGIKLLVDDFGTGYSSLAQLQSLDFDVLKVDRAFTSKLEGTEEGAVFFKAIITMAHALGMRVVAEGVENAEQIGILKALCCDEVQGFCISRPLPAEIAVPIFPRSFMFPAG